jgi:hypothetical protein
MIHEGPMKPNNNQTKQSKAKQTNTKQNKSRNKTLDAAPTLIQSVAAEEVLAVVVARDAKDGVHSAQEKSWKFRQRDIFCFTA